MFDDTRQVKWCNEKTGTEQVPPPKLYRNPGSNIVHLTIRKGQMAETFIDLGEKQQESQTTFLVNPRRRFHRVFNFQFRDLEPLQVDRFVCCFSWSSQPFWLYHDLYNLHSPILASFRAAKGWGPLGRYLPLYIVTMIAAICLAAWQFADGGQTDWKRGG